MYLFIYLSVEVIWRRNRSPVRLFTCSTVCYSTNLQVQVRNYNGNDNSRTCVAVPCHPSVQAVYDCTVLGFALLLYHWTTVQRWRRQEDGRCEPLASPWSSCTADNAAVWRPLLWWNGCRVSQLPMTSTLSASSPSSHFIDYHQFSDVFAAGK